MLNLSIDIRGLLREARGRFGFGGETSALSTFEEFGVFVCHRSAYIAQKKLYEYVKTRMGTRYVRMFEDDVYIGSLNIARMHVFAACLSDLTIFATAYVTAPAEMEPEERRDMAIAVYEHGIEANLEHAPDPDWARDAIAAFALRAGTADWHGRALDWRNFSHSPAALFRFAPIAEELRDFDRDIVENSIKFAWRDVREAFRKRVDPPAILADWERQREGEGEASVDQGRAARA